MRLALFASFLLVLQAGIAQSATQPQTCLACHGAGGVSATPLTPSLAGLPAFYVVAQLFLFREGRRLDAAMNGVAKGLTDDDLRALSDHFSRLAPPAPPREAPDAERYARGRDIVAQGHCANCHGPRFDGENNVPRIANQREDYLLKALKEYKAGTRIGYGNAVMPETVSGMSEPELVDVAHFLQHLKP